MHRLPVGKLPPDLLACLLAAHPSRDPRVLLGPGPGLDCAVLDFGDRLLVAKSDPITFTAQDIGWYAVQVNANDIATTGARPRWFLATLLLPEGSTDPGLASTIFDQIAEACATLGAELIGGHTEITAGLDRPILAGTMLGEVAPGQLITPRGARAGDRLLLTKAVPLEGASILAREFPDRLAAVGGAALDRARGFLHDPGIGVVPEALAAAEAGGVTAMHDPTEAGILGGLWELAEAAGLRLEIDPARIPILPEAKAMCAQLGIDPLAVIASGSLLIACRPEAMQSICDAIRALKINVVEIGQASEGQGVFVRTPAGLHPAERPLRDALAGLMETPAH